MTDKPDFKQFVSGQLRAELVEQTIRQINKDLEMVDEAISRPGHPEDAYEAIFQQVQSILRRLIHLNYNQYLNLLYRIDISEEQIKKAMDTQPESDLSEVSAELVIKREFQKIVIRNYYSSEKG